MSPYLEIARKAAREGARAALKYYQAGVKVDLKEDRTPVTIADREAENVMISVIRGAFSDHGFFGEETGRSGDPGDFTWIIDPIDGTKNFIDGIPVWGNLIALMHRGEIVLGMSYVPLPDEILWAEKGQGAYLNGEPVHVSSHDRVGQCMLSFGSWQPFEQNGWGGGLISLIRDCRRHRAFGDLWPYHLLACGKLDIVIEASIKAVDVAPFVCILAEAGGQVSQIDGSAFDLRVSSFAATNGRVHERVPAYFSEK